MVRNLETDHSLWVVSEASQRSWRAQHVRCDAFADVGFGVVGEASQRRRSAMGMRGHFGTYPVRGIRREHRESLG